MKRAGQPAISHAGTEALNQYKAYLQHKEDMSQVTIRNYRSDLRQFIAWCEASWREGHGSEQPFAPTSVVTPTLTWYWSHLQTVLRLKTTSVNRALMSLKRYFAWSTDGSHIQHNPSRAVKLVPAAEQAPRQLSDREEERLVASFKAI
jgi:integrase/recombinase XerD